MILTVGDSVCWGQGLLEEHKFDFLYAKAKGMALTRAAHSAAVIGMPTDSSTEVENGEIPVGPPSVWQQVLAQTDWPEIKLVLLNGGLNDVGLTRILSPWTSTVQLEAWVNQFCNSAMHDLLEAVAGKLALPQARIAVLGYYPILSPSSKTAEIQVRSLLEVHGVATISVLANDQFSFSAILPRVVDNCITFWNSSNDAFQTAVDSVNRKLGRDICVFIKLPLTEANALWSPQSLLWGLTPALLPEDEVADSRGRECEALYGDVVHIAQRIQCARASVGHPNIQGAAKIADAISLAL